MEVEHAVRLDRAATKPPIPAAVESLAQWAWSTRSLRNTRFQRPDGRDVRCCFTCRISDLRLDFVAR
jgi:hypothetical protein